MTLRTFVLPPLAALAVSAAPPLEASSESMTQAERRLRACLTTHASGAGPSLEAAILATRAACKPQIDAVRDVRIIEVTAGLAPDAARVVEQRVTREFNNEIAHAIALFSGLSESHAHH